jgi:hypothetical protein
MNAVKITHHVTVRNMSGELFRSWPFESRGDAEIKKQQVLLSTIISPLQVVIDIESLEPDEQPSRIRQLSFKHFG